MQRSGRCTDGLVEFFLVSRYLVVVKEARQERFNEQ